MPQQRASAVDSVREVHGWHEGRETEGKCCHWLRALIRSICTTRLFLAKQIRSNECCWIEQLLSSILWAVHDWNWLTSELDCVYVCEKISHLPNEKLPSQQVRERERACNWPRCGQRRIHLTWNFKLTRCVDQFCNELPSTWTVSYASRASKPASQPEKRWKLIGHDERWLARQRRRLPGRRHIKSIERIPISESRQPDDALLSNQSMIRPALVSDSNALTRLIAQSGGIGVAFSLHLFASLSLPSYLVAALCHMVVHSPTGCSLMQAAQLQAGLIDCLPASTCNCPDWMRSCRKSCARILLANLQIWLPCIRSHIGKQTD